MCQRCSEDQQLLVVSYGIQRRVLGQAEQELSSCSSSISGNSLFACCQQLCRNNFAVRGSLNRCWIPLLTETLLYIHCKLGLAE